VLGISQGDGLQLTQSPAPDGHLAFTERAKTVLGLSLRDALQLGQNYIGTEHLLLALLHVEDGLAPMVLARLAGKPATVRAKLLELLETEGGDPETKAPGPPAPLSRAIHDVIADARQEAIAQRASEVEPAHLFLAAARRPDGAAAGMHRDADVDPEAHRLQASAAGSDTPGQRPTPTALCGPGNCFLVPPTRPPSHATCPNPGPEETLDDTDPQ
jgi:ATP-dependent Clp protease ATP-binding subunit ClpA